MDWQTKLRLVETDAEGPDDFDNLDQRFRDDVLTGLGQEQKTIPARWFYDRRGSELFEEITELPEYYPTRTEIGILRDSSKAVAQLVGMGRAVIEFGAGSATKTPLLLDSIAPSAYVPVDISGDFLRDSCEPLERRYPDLPIYPVEADFTRPVQVPEELQGSGLMGFFPGSTIGNMGPASAVDLLRSMRETLGEGSFLVIGMDRIKQLDVLIPAYDDAAGVTAQFNLNLAHRINREMDGTIPVDSLRHQVTWNDLHARIEMHLEALEDIGFAVCGRQFTMREGETIHTENSHKYDDRSANMLLFAGGWRPVSRFSDRRELFKVIVAEAMEAGITA